MFILATALISTTGCNNQRNNRLSAANACDTSMRRGVQATDPTAFELTDQQKDAFTEVNTSEFPDSEALAVISIISTFNIPLNNEEEAVIRLSNTNVQSNKNVFTVACALNLPDDAVGERIAEMPTSNENGGIQLKKFKIEIGNPKREDQSDFIRVTLVPEDVPEESSEGDAAEEEVVAPPVPFSNYFSSDQDEVTYYKLTDKKESEKSAEQLQKISYFIHYKNDAERVRSRITVSRIIKDKKK
jgi:hypothetical protein